MNWILLDFSSYFSLVHIFFHNVFYSISSMFSFDWFNLSIILFGIFHLYSEYWKINRNSFRFGRKKELECRKNAAAVVHLSGKWKNSSECEKKKIMVSDGKLQIFHCSFFVDSAYEGREWESVDLQTKKELSKTLFVSFPFSHSLHSVLFLSLQTMKYSNCNFAGVSAKSQKNVFTSSIIRHRSLFFIWFTNETRRNCMKMRAALSSKYQNVSTPFSSQSPSAADTQPTHFFSLKRDSSLMTLNFST